MSGPVDRPVERIDTLRHGGMRFDVLDEGPIEGEVIVLLHGFPERSSTWREVAPVLHAAGYRTLAMDQRGYSPGARPRRRRDYRIGRLVADVAALVDAAGSPAHVVGHDWGAVVAWSLAALRPDLVRSITAISVPHPQAFLRAALTSRQAAASWYMLAMQVPGVVEGAGKRPGGLLDRLLRHTGMTPAEVVRFRDEIVDYGALPGAVMWYRALPLLDTRLFNNAVKVPSTLLWSDGDEAVTRVAAEGNRRCVDGSYRFVELSGVSHWIPTQAPEACAEAILDQVRG